MATMQSKNLSFEPLTAAHAEALFPILVTPGVLAFIDPVDSLPTLEELKSEYKIRARGPINTSRTVERWFNMAVKLQTVSTPVIGRLEATGYGECGEVAYLLGEAWWGKGLAFEAMTWWHDYLSTAAPGTEWWATVHPDNRRSIRLLGRLGYKKVASDELPAVIQSYDPGDHCFVRAAHRLRAPTNPTITQPSEPIASFSYWEKLKSRL